MIAGGMCGGGEFHLFGKGSSPNGHFFLASLRLAEGDVPRNMKLYVLAAAVKMLCSLCCVVGLASAQPTFKIGGTLAQCGPALDYPTTMRTALQFYANYTNSQGGIIVNGTAYQIELILCVRPQPLFEATTKPKRLSSQVQRCARPRVGRCGVCAWTRGKKTHRVRVEILYERLINVDQVDALLSPFSVTMPAFALAKQYKVRFCPLPPLFVTSSAGADRQYWRFLLLLE